MSLVSIARRSSVVSSPPASSKSRGNGLTETCIAQNTSPPSGDVDDVFPSSESSEDARFLDNLVHEAVVDSFAEIETEQCQETENCCYSNTEESSLVDSNTPSANYCTIKGAAVFLSHQSFRSSSRPKTPVVKHAEISRHLELMLDRLRDEDQMMMAAKLEQTSPNRVRYLTLINCSFPDGSTGSVEALNEIPSTLLGFDVTSNEQGDQSENVTLGLAIAVEADMKIRLNGDGGFSVVTADDRSYSFKPIAVQVMWACLHSVTEAVSRACRLASPSWLSFYTNAIDSDAGAIADWQINDDVISRLPPADSESAIELEIRDQLRTLMSSIDLEEASSRTIRTSLETAMNRDLSAYRKFIDEEMLVLLGQLDLPSKIYDYLYLGSEWNASDIRVLTRLGISHVVNVSREIDNFFPTNFQYFNVRVYDDESTELLRYWNSVNKFINAAKEANGRVLVHCKMGVSRSAACVTAYCMKANGMSCVEAIKYVRSRRACVQPNKGFLEQLNVYEGILKASRVRYSDLFKKVDEIVNGESDAKVNTRPISYHEGSEPSLCSQSLFLSCPVNSLGSKIAAFEKKPKDASAVRERRMRNRTSPAFPSAFEIFSSNSSSDNTSPTTRMYIGDGNQNKRDSDVSSDLSLNEDDISLLQTGHVKRVTAQLNQTAMSMKSEDSLDVKSNQNPTGSLGRRSVASRSWAAMLRPVSTELDN